MGKGSRRGSDRPATGNPDQSGHSRLPTRSSARRDSVPVNLLPIAAHPQVIEHRFHLELELGLTVVRLAVDADVGFPLELDELRAEPDVEGYDAA